MEQAMREEFEAWVWDIYEETLWFDMNREFVLKRNGDEYFGNFLNDRWEAWKASRAALRVVLPEVGSAPDGAKNDLGFGDPKFAHDYREQQVSAAMRQLCREALQQAGIEVAP